MGCKINPTTISKLLSALTEYFDSEYRGKLYNITDFHVQPGCKELDNFLSSIYKVSITIRIFTTSGDRNSWEDRAFNFICKSTILEDSPDNLEKYYWSILFTKEKLVFDFLEEMGQELAALCPKIYHCYSEGETYSCFLLQDLVASGFYMTPNSVEDGLSLVECNLVMKSLARLHALSLVLEGKQGCRLPLKYEICTTELLFSTGVEPALKPLTYNSFQGILKLVENYRPDLFQALKRIDEAENIWNRLCELVKPGKSSFSCFCHGDVRLNNIFVEEKDPTSNKPFTNVTTNNSSTTNHDQKSISPSQEKNCPKVNEEGGLRFIDFQLTRYASPLTDLQYCLHMCADREFREKYTDQVLETYYTEFSSVLARFPGVKLVQDGVSGWTLKKLKEEYEQFHMYGFLVSLILLPMILLRPGVDIDKSMSQMTKAERNQFFTDGRAELVFNIGSRNETMRQRLFEMCDEMVAKNVI